MTKIYQIAGTDIGRMMQHGAKKGFTLMNHPVEDLTEGHMDLLIARDRMVAGRDIAARHTGIGSIKAQKFQNSVDMFTDAIHGLNSADPELYMHKIEEAILGGEYSLHNEVAGIGCPDTIGKIRANHAQRRRAKMDAQVQAETVSGIGAKKTAQKAKTKTGGFIKKAAQKAKGTVQKAGAKVKVVAKKAGAVAKKVAKGALKVATAPQRLVVKGILEILLPKAAPFFLYLFINDPKIIAKLPSKVKRKRDKALKAQRFIVNVIGMKDAHFMGIIRNGIMKQMGTSPENILAAKLKGISGVGFVGVSLAIAAKAAPVVIEIIKKLIAAFKKNKGDAEEPGEDDAPSDNDFEELPMKEASLLANEIKAQNDMPDPESELKPTNNNSGGSSSNGKPSSNSNGGGSSSNEDRSESAGGEDGPGLITNSGQASKQEKEVDKAEDVSTEEIKTDENGEIKKEPFSTGGAKTWNSLGK